jgi:hypothetical protein
VSAAEAGEKVGSLKASTAQPYVKVIHHGIFPRTDEFQILAKSFYGTG